MLSGQKNPFDARGAAEVFRDAMRLHAAGVCIITVGLGNAVNGMAATAVTSFSMEPPSVLVCVNEAASIAPNLAVGLEFSVAVLARQHESVVAAFSRKPAGRPRFDHGLWILEDGCRPLLQDAIANLECVAEKTTSYGSHRAVIGRVVEAHLGPKGESLIYRDGAFA